MSLTNNKAKTREGNKVVNDVKFARPSSSNTGATVCLSINNAPYVKIECMENRINFTAAEKACDDGCFYSKYVSGVAKIYVPESIVESYTDSNGYPLIGRTVPREQIENGYSLIVKRKKTVALPKFLSYEDNIDVDLKGFAPVEACCASELKNTVNRIAKNRLNYTVGVYLGETAGIIIRPGVHADMTLSDWRQWFGGRMQYCLGSIEYNVLTGYTKTFVPLYWTKQFPKNSQFTISKREDGTILVQCESKCIVDNATTRSAEFNSGTRYICSDCAEEAAKQDTEIVGLLEGVVAKYEEVCKANAILKTQLETMSRELAVMKEYVSFDTATDNPIVRKFLNQTIQEQKRRIEELETKIKESEPVIEIVTYADLT